MYYSTGFTNFSLPDQTMFALDEIKIFSSLIKFVPKNYYIPDFNNFYQTMNELFLNNDSPAVNLIEQFYQVCKGTRNHTTLINKSKVCSSKLGERFSKCGKKIVTIRNKLIKQELISCNLFRQLSWGLIEVYKFFSNSIAVRFAIENLLAEFTIVTKEDIIHLQSGNLIDRTNNITLRELRDQNWKVGNYLTYNDQLIQVLNWNYDQAVVLVNDQVQVISLDVVVNV